jgi:non-homologous end joining protein Ku
MAPRAHWKGYLKLSLVSCPVALHPAIAAAERISFRQMNRQTGNRLRQQLVDSVTGEVVQSHDKGRGYEAGERQLLLVEDEELEAARQDARARPFATAPVAQEAPPPVEPPAPAGRRAPASRDEPARPETPGRGSPLASAPPPAAAPPPAPVRAENTRTIQIERFVPLDQIDARYFDTPYYITPRDEIGLEAYAVIRDAMRGKELVGMGRVVLSKARAARSDPTHGQRALRNDPALRA